MNDGLEWKVCLTMYGMEDVHARMCEAPMGLCFPKGFIEVRPLVLHILIHNLQYQQDFITHLRANFSVVVPRVSIHD